MKIELKCFYFIVMNVNRYCYIVLKCDCSFPDKFFVTGRFQVGFVQNKSEIVLLGDLALRLRIPHRTNLNLNLSEG